jgi:tetratricopeptide (TPR) repeat protein
VIAAVFAPLAACAISAALAPPCPTLAEDLTKELAQSTLAMEPEGVRRTIYDRASAAIARCPGNETLAYLRLRAAELSVDDPMGQIISESSLKVLAQESSLEFPGSASIATVRARLEGTVDLARKAAAIDPTYLPARMALAAALLRAGDIAGASGILESAKDLSRLDDGYAILAQARLASHDSEGAIRAARQQLTGRKLFRLEPGGGGEGAVGAAHEVLALAFVSRGQFAKAAPHVIAAESRSTRVRELMKNASPALRREVARARRSGEQR